MSVSGHHRLAATDKVSMPKLIGGWIYYCNLSDDSKMYKTDGIKNVKINDHSVQQSFYIHDNWIYYSNTSDIERLYKIKTDGSESIKLSNQSIDEVFYVFDNWIYYHNIPKKENNSQEYRVSTIYRVKIDGTKIEQLCNRVTYSIKVYNGNIYYSSPVSIAGGVVERRIYKISLNNKKEKRLSNKDFMSDIYPIGDWIYYYRLEPSDFAHHNKKTGIFRVHINGSRNYFFE